MKITRILLALLIISALGFTACSDDDGATPATKATLSLSLTDAPAEYDAVNITFSEVAVSMNGGWVVLSGEEVTVNLLEWNNGKSLELGRADVDPGKVTQIRLMVTKAEIMIGNTVHDVTIPSAEQTGLKLVTNFELVAGSTYEFVIDFDAHSSIVTTGNPQNPNGYKLKPTLRVAEKATTGSISGTVTNPGNAAIATASQNGVDITSTPVDLATGSFRLAYLEAGSYDISITSSVNLVFTQDNITVTAGADNALGSITLQ
jgi:hypothetical protein